MQAALAAVVYELTEDASSIDQFPWHRLRLEDLQRLRMLVGIDYAPATANRIFAAVRGVLRACRALGYISAEQQMRLNNIPPVLQSALFETDLDAMERDLTARFTGRGITQEEIQTLLRACHKDPRPAGRRDAALLALLYGVGLQCTEAVNLDLADYLPAARSVTIRQNKEKAKRSVVVHTGIMKALHRWLLARGEEPGPFFMPISKSGRPQARRLTTRSIAWILKQRSIETNVPPFSPRDLRRSFLACYEPTYIHWTES
jgi:integrase